MPNFDITGPDGLEYTIDGPEGSTREDALRMAPELKAAGKLRLKATGEPEPAPAPRGALDEVFGAFKDLRGTPAERAALRRAGEAIKGTSADYRRLLGMEEDIDYSAGARYPVQVSLQRASNAQEAAALLDQVYGSGNFGQDAGGRWWA